MYKSIIMFIEKYITSFWQGKLKLWQSFWLVGGLIGIIIGQIIIFIEEKIFGNPSQNPFEFSFRAKILILIWVIYTTVGIWRSSERYEGLFLWKISTKIYIIINCLSTIFLLFFFNFNQIY